MVDGVVAKLDELIGLRRYAQSVQYQPEGRALRSGNHISKLRGRGMDFSEVRNYQAGDEIRHMEWRVTARTGRPHVKIYQEERERPVVILADFNPSMIFGTRIAFKSVVAARLAKDEGIKIYTIGLGSEADPRALTHDFLIPNASADLDEETLQHMSDMTGGRYFRATDTESLHSIYNTINQLETINQEQATIRPQKDYYPWCVGLALLLCFYWLANKANVVTNIKSLFQSSGVFKI